MIRFEGTIRQARRGGWHARGLVLTQRNGQVVETQLGPLAFESVETSRKWLRSAAVTLAIEDVRIVVKDASIANRIG